MHARWARVTRSNPCPVCRKPDWCGVSADGALACCMRIESPRPARNGGWLHRIGEPAATPCPVPPVPDPQPTIDSAALIARWHRETPPQRVIDLAGKLGVDSYSLAALRACWASPHNAWAFPMRDGQGGMVGVRLRNDAGKKWAVRGSRSGIFVPVGVTPQDVALICEGPTDTAAALSIGYWAIGRPSCNQGAREIHATLVRAGVKRMVIVGDNDKPGIQGAQRVASEIPMPAKMWLPPCKDIRAFVQAGGTRQLIDSGLRNQAWKRYGRRLD